MLSQKKRSIFLRDSVSKLNAIFTSPPPPFFFDELYSFLETYRLADDDVLLLWVTTVAVCEQFNETHDRATTMTPRSSTDNEDDGVDAERRRRLAYVVSLQRAILTHQPRVHIPDGLRMAFFACAERLATHAVFDALPVLGALTRHGTSIAPFHAHFAPFLARCLGAAPRAIAREPLLHALRCADGLLRHNLVFCEHAASKRMVEAVCVHADAAIASGAAPLVVDECVRVLLTATRARRMPAESLDRAVLATLCRAVNVERCGERAVATMRAVLVDTVRAFVCVSSLCGLLERALRRQRAGDDAATNTDILHAANADMLHGGDDDDVTAAAAADADAQLLRGAVFFLASTCWGSRRMGDVEPRALEQLDVPPGTVLPQLAALAADARTPPLVAYEVALSVRRLVKKFGHALTIEWLYVFAIMRGVQRALERRGGDANNREVLQSLATTLDALDEASAFAGDRGELLEILCDYTAYRDETRVLRDMAPPVESGDDDASKRERLLDLFAPTEAGWLERLQRFMAAHYVRERRSSIRLAALELLERTVRMHRLMFETDVVERLVLPYVARVADERDEDVALAALALVVRIAVDFAARQFYDLVDVLRAALDARTSRNAIADAAAAGLVRIFVAKFPLANYEHTLHALRALLRHASHPTLSVRHRILSCLARFSANARCRVVHDGRLSAYLTCVAEEGGGAPPEAAAATATVVMASAAGPAAAASIGVLPVAELFGALHARLVDESNWEVFALVLRALQAFLRNAYFVVSLNLASLARLLCQRLASRSTRYALVDRLADVAADGDEERVREVYYVAYDVLSLIASGGARRLSAAEQAAIADVLATGVRQWLPRSGAERPHVWRLCVNAASLAMATMPATAFLSDDDADRRSDDDDEEDDGGVLSELIDAITHAPLSAFTEMHVLQFFNLLVQQPALSVAVTPGQRERIVELLLRCTSKQQHPGLAILSYQILARYFVSVPLQERPPLHARIAATIEKRRADERCTLAEANAALFARYLYTTRDPQSRPSPFHSSLLSDADAQRHWLFGNALYSVRAGRHGFTELTVRTPNGAEVFVQRRATHAEATTSLIDVEFFGSNQQQQQHGGGGSESVVAPNDGARRANETRDEADEATSGAAFAVHSLLTQVPFKDSTPLPLAPTDALRRAIGVIDRTFCIKTHKIGILYKAPGQTTARDVLSNSFGSTRYNRFVERMGDPLPLRAATFYTGGLDVSAAAVDGEYGVFWRDNFTHVAYHVATLMPAPPPTDAECTSKMRHIGNNYVNIVFNDTADDADETYAAAEIVPGQFNFVSIVITPRRAGLYYVDVQVRKDELSFGPISRAHLVTKEALAFVVRHTALSADVAASIRVDGARGRLSNAEERLRLLQSLRDAALKQ